MTEKVRNIFPYVPEGFNRFGEKKRLISLVFGTPKIG